MERVNKTIWQMVNEIAARHPERDALIHQERGMRFDYQSLALESGKAARGMLALGIEKGSRVGLWAPNIPEWIIAFLGITAMGGIVVPIDPGAGEDDLRFILEQSESDAVVLAIDANDGERPETIRKVLAGLPLVKQAIAVSDRTFPGMTSWADLLATGAGASDEPFRVAAGSVSPEASAAIMYTSGTTGRPKGVVLDHLGLLNKSVFSTDRMGVSHADRLCLFFPLFHMFGNTCIALAGLIQGAALIMPSVAFSPPEILRAVREEKCTAVYGSPSMMMALLEHPDFRKDDWTSVKKGIVGGAPCPSELMRRLVEEIGVSGMTVAYGITETSSWIAMTHPDDPLDRRTGTIGTALGCNEVKIVDPRTGEDLPAGAPGELCTRGFLMKGYYRMPGATANAIDHDGWYHTGDLGKMDERGYFYVTGRLKDVIRRNGMEIYPSEIEEILYRHPDVAEAQVFGFPHPEKGQEAAAWVRPRGESPLAAKDVASYLAERLSPGKMPGDIRIVAGFPMTRSGKAQKFKLAEIAAATAVSGQALPLS